MLRMTVFARRSIQSFLNALNTTLTRSQLASLVTRLNLNDRDSVAAEWEVSVLLALRNKGHVTYEPRLSGAKRPDILFKSNSVTGLQFIADVTLTSDANLEEKNPIGELTDLVASRARKLGISGTFSFTPDFTTTGSHNAYKVQLSIPHKGHLQTFVRDHIVPRLRSIAKSPAEPRAFSITQAGYRLNLSYAPGQRVSVIKYRAYRNATKKDSNPLFNALESKRQQLRDTQYDGCRGIIVCDGGCELLSKQFTSWDSYSKEHVVREIFRRSRSVSFVVMVWVERVPHSNRIPRPHRVNVQVEVNAQARYPVAEELKSLLQHLHKQWPQPIQSAEEIRLQLEGRARRQTPRYWGRRFGGHKMGAGPNSLTYRMSARELMEILAGRRAHEAFQKDAGFDSASDRGPINPFENALRRNFTISDVRVERVPDQDDDWIEFRMTGPDSALAPFQVPS